MAVHSEPRPYEVDASSVGFRHGALLYRGDFDFLAGTTAFILQGLEEDEPVLVAVDADRIGLLRDELGAVATAVEFVDMAVLGHNPARIIPAWRSFVARRATDGRPVRGIGEPIWPGRAAAEVVECQRHEALLNVAFASSSPFSLLCPYDVSELPRPVITEALRSHPDVRRDGAALPWRPVANHEMARVHLDTPLPEPAVPFRELEFGLDDVHAVRSFVTDAAVVSRMSRERCYDLVVAVSELATNSVLYGGGSGLFRVWVEDDRVVCELRDQGRLDDPMVGREQPSVDDTGHRGLWMVNQLCDLVQIRVFPSGTVVRVHMQAG